MDYQSLHNKTVVELRALAKELRVKIPAGTSKAMIVELLLESEKAEAEAQRPAVQPIETKTEEIAPEKEEKNDPAENASRMQDAENTKTTENSEAPRQAYVRPQYGYPQNVRPQRPVQPRQGFVRSPEPGYADGAMRRNGDGMFRRTGTEPYRRNADENGRYSAGGEEQGAEFVRRRDNYEFGPDGAPIGDFADGAGILEMQTEGHGFLRAENFLPGNSDIYISNAQIRRFNLRNGDHLEGKIRPQREGDRYGAMIYINRINGETPDRALSRKPFESLIPVYPDRRLRLENGKNHDLSLRLIDLLAPIGKGQRGMIVAQPKAGKTTLLKKIANAISENNPEVKLIVLLIDERPEEVTDMKRSINGEVVYSTFDEAPENHARVSEMVLEHARRLVEMGKDVVILMDSITRLARAYNLVIPPTGRSLSGGLDPGALYKPKKFFGAARSIENGGSLTIIATALVDTGSRMDDIIFEEFKGTGNMELHLDRRLSDKRIFPAIDLTRSGTRREELLLTEKELEGAYTVRKMLSGGNVQQNIETLIDSMEKTASNEEFLARVKSWACMYEKDGFTMGR